MLVHVVKTWNEPDLFRQTPGGKGEWDGIRFTEDAVAACDYLVVLNAARERVSVSVDPRNVWALIQEPAAKADVFPFVRRGHRRFARVYTDHPGLTGRRYRHSQTCLPWHVNRSYDELTSTAVPEKARDLSWVTSNLAFLPGYRDRLAFLDRLREEVDFDLFGKGYRFIEDKWDALAPYRYSIAFENQRGPDYWTEKLADCFLAWTLPLYFGCTNVTDYFPAESMVLLDADPDVALEQVQEAIATDQWRKRLDAIAHARDLVLNRHQFFPFVAGEIRKAAAEGTAARPRRVVIEAFRPRTRSSLASRIRRRFLPERGAR